MPLSIDKALGIHDEALMLRARRAELLAENLANADTPHYKARDFDFRAALEQAGQGRPSTGLAVTHAGHIQGAGPALNPELLYRIPGQPSLDGNTVDPQLEKAAFAENAVHYQATLLFLNRKIASIKGALKGE